MRLNARAIPGDEPARPVLLLAVEDVTHLLRKQAERENQARQLQETQRLESLGVLAGGIAHDFNNTLTAILGFAQLIELELPARSPLLPRVERICVSARHAADLCNQMLAYSGRGRFQLRLVDLSALIGDSASLLDAMIGKKSQIRYALRDGLPPVEVDVAQIRQVLANLVINASDALGETGGDIIVASGVGHFDSAYLQESVGARVPAGLFVYLEVADAGPGMNADTQARIFDPFFTTKFTGRGLGLAAVLGIVRGHRAALRVNSAPGMASTFRLLLPAAKGEPTRETDSLRGHTGLSWKGHGTVLVVDDEADVRLVLRGILERLGFGAEEARDGREGIERLRALAEQIRVVLLDLTMPGLGGLETFQEMRRQHSDLRIILMSGYDQSEATRSFPATGLAGFLRKPFVLTDLADSLRQIFVRDGNQDTDPMGEASTS